MSDTYGAFRPKDNREAFVQFGIRIDILDQESKSGPYGEVTWPYYPVLLFRCDTNERIAIIKIPTMNNAVLDESNVFDLLEYLIFNFGQSIQGHGYSSHDRTLISADPDYDSVTLRRAVGCRHFIFRGKDTKQVHVTKHGPGIENDKARFDISELLLIDMNFEFKIGSWWSGVDVDGVKLNFRPSVNGIEEIFDSVLNTGSEKDRTKTYHAPFSFPPTPKQISLLQMSSAKKIVENPDNLANQPVGSYDPYRLNKRVHSRGFWYLRSGDGKVILTVIPYPALTAIDCALHEIRSLKPEVATTWRDRYTKAIGEFEEKGREKEKEIVRYTIKFLDLLPEPEE